jgi:lysophospholipase L1-like esterase
VAERIHTEYDPLLGWINKPDLYIKDMYGPDKYFQTNSQRFRNNSNFDTSIPEGKRRWICCGDSFTLGYGVDNDNTWAALLSSLVPDIETVNMGQGGYGIDQAYLWFMRDGIKLQYDLLIFAFISADLTRAISSKYRDYPKPLLSVKEGIIIKNNIPVPHPGFTAQHLPKIESAIKSLRVTTLAHALLNILRRSDHAPNTKREETVTRVKKLTSAIFNSLYDYNKQNQRTILFIYLPTQMDYRNNIRTRIARSFLSSQAEQNRWLFIDLIDDFRSLAPEDVSELFIQRDLPGYKESKGHYTEKGNQYIADLIIKKITGNPETRGLLDITKLQIQSTAARTEGKETYD